MDDPDREPSLTQLLVRALGAQGAAHARETWQELTELAGKAWKERALRRKANIQARLRHAEESDAQAVAVRILDLSASGVRVRLPRSAPLDVMRADRMYLTVSVEGPSEAQVLGLFVSFVRVAAMEHGHAEVAFRFAHPSDETQRKLDRIHAHYFSD